MAVWISKSLILWGVSLRSEEGGRGEEKGGEEEEPHLPLRVPLGPPRAAESRGESAESPRRVNLRWWGGEIIGVTDVLIPY